MAKSGGGGGRAASEPTRLKDAPPVSVNPEKNTKSAPGRVGPKPGGRTPGNKGKTKSRS